MPTDAIIAGPKVVHSRPQNREGVLAVLRSARDDVRAFHVTALYLYGSAARNEMTEDGDVDVFIDFQPDSRFSLFDQLGLQEHLSAILQRDVDLTTRGGLHPVLRSCIEHSSIRVL